VAATFPLPNAAAIALGDSAFIVTTQSLFRLATAAPSGMPPDLLPLNFNAVSAKVAVGNGRVYVLSTNLLNRVVLPAVTTISPVSVVSPTDLAAGVAEVFWGESAAASLVGAIRVLRDASGTAETVASAFEPRYLAHDGARVYWTDAVSSAAPAQRRIWKLVGTTATPVPIPETPAITGLAVDAQCVYYWNASSNAVGLGAIRVAPK
jgi:hypothetical protein